MPNAFTSWRNDLMCMKWRLLSSTHSSVRWTSECRALQACLFSAPMNYGAQRVMCDVLKDLIASRRIQRHSDGGLARAVFYGVVNRYVLSTKYRLILATAIEHNLPRYGLIPKCLYAQLMTEFLDADEASTAFRRLLSSSDRLKVELPIGLAVQRILGANTPDPARGQFLGIAWSIASGGATQQIRSQARDVLLRHGQALSGQSPVE